MKKISILILTTLLFSCSPRKYDCNKIKVFFLDGTIDTLIVEGKPTLVNDKLYVYFPLSSRCYSSGVKYFQIIEPCEPTK